jgi:murein DD-endopeptidase MepM/ murein hydrolase activator NlpD
MAYILSDVYIGNYPITQPFGARPDIYSARYGMKGHNGLDIGCPSLTPVLATADGVVKEAQFDQNGFGNYVKLTHPTQLFLSLYGHLNNSLVKPGDHVVKGQLLGLSDNTGFSDGAHLHFGVAPCDDQGNKTQPDNGYSGYIDPMGTDCVWHVSNPTQPVSSQTETAPALSIAPDELSIKTIQANNFLTIVNYGMNNGLGVYLTNHGEALDLINNPNDVDGGRKVNEYISDLITQIAQLKESGLGTPDQVVSAVNGLPQDKKASLLGNLFNSVKGFIFK